MIAYAPKRLVIHHTAGMDGFDAIRRMHKQENRWVEIGYNALVERDGVVRWGRPLGTMPAANAGQNSGTAAYAGVGDNTVVGREWTGFQFAALARMIAASRLLYPGIEVCGHDALKATACPGLDIDTYFPG